MKLLYIKMTNSYCEDFTYQENILPGKFVQLGYETHLFVSRRSSDKFGKSILVSPRIYINKEKVIVHILPFSKHLKHISNKLGRYDVLYDEIARITPDIIFVHSLQFLSISSVAKYKRNHPNVRLFVDNHADFIIMPIDTFKRKLIQKGIFRFLARRMYDVVDRFYGVSPSRAAYLHEVYSIPNNKIDVITQGGDENIISKINRAEERKTICEKYNIPYDDILIVSGAGNIDERKREKELLMALEGFSGYSIVLFGSFATDEKKSCQRYLEMSNVHYIGRISGEESYKYLVAADLVLFPGRHSVLWDQAVACGTPLIIKYWKGMDYFDVNGNCIYLFDGSKDEIYNVLYELKMHPEKIKKLKEAASGRAKKQFSYIQIARTILQLPD